MNRLFRSIDILDDKSLTVIMDNTRSNLWVLRHFKDLTISLRTSATKSIMDTDKEKTLSIHTDG